MKPGDIPNKTAAGQREVGARAHKLSPRARSLLIMIHGSDTVTDLTRSMRSLGDVNAILDELLGLGLVVLTPAGAPSKAVAANDPAPALRPAPVPSADALPPAQEVKLLLNQTAVAALGLRAFLFTLKLEHCYTAEELRAILPEYRRVVGKSKGEEFAGAVIKRAESLLARA